MNYVGLFEGISGFGLAFKRAGANILAVCEIDKTCQSVLRRHHPNAEIISDVKTITKDSFNGLSVSILAGGFPCQDLSVAGQRKGLAGERSGLWFEFIRIIGDHKPRWVVIENVPGLLSSNGGRDFAIILRGLAECGYFVAYRVLDSQYDGVAQRRNRVFLVASLGTADCAEILFERESGQWDSPPSREARQDVAGTLSARTSAGGGLGTDLECNGGLQPVTGTLAASGAGSQRPAGQCNELDFLVPYGRRADRPNGGLYVNETEQANTLTNAGQNGTVIAFTERTRAEGRTVEASEELAYSLTDASKGGNPHSGKIAGQFGVRRLTPTECERLQGFPDGWTAFGHDDKPISDSSRYRMLGNAVCVPTAEWIARRIVDIENKGQR